MTTKKLTIAVIGPKGQCGSCVVDELLSRGHKVVGISRSPPKIWNKPGEYSSIAVDLADTPAFTQALSGGYDCIVCAFGPSLERITEVYFKTIEGHVLIKKAMLRSSHEGGFIIIGTS
jgi:putative NADH-flavin reductase